MITSKQLINAERAKNEAAEIVYNMIDVVQFVFVGIDSEYVYFNVVARLSQITDRQMVDLTQKTRFELIAESSNRIYKGEFRISHS